MQVYKTQKATKTKKEFALNLVNAEIQHVSEYQGSKNFKKLWTEPSKTYRVRMVVPKKKK